MAANDIYHEPPDLDDYDTGWILNTDLTIGGEKMPYL
jgi:hypothetical protein